MSNGEKLPPQDVEFALLHDPVFEQVMLVGEARPVPDLADGDAGRPTSRRCSSAPTSG